MSLLIMFFTINISQKYKLKQSQLWFHSCNHYMHIALWLPRDWTRISVLMNRLSYFTFPWLESSSPLPWTLGGAKCGMLHGSACGPCTGLGWSPCACCFSVRAAGAGADGDPWWYVLFFFPPPPPYPQGLLPHLKSQQRTSEKRGESLCSSSYFVLLLFSR